MLRDQRAPRIQDILRCQINIYILMIGAVQHAEKFAPALRANAGDIARDTCGIQMRRGQ